MLADAADGAGGDEPMPRTTRPFDGGAAPAAGGAASWESAWDARLARSTADASGFGSCSGE
eukprot:COSAG04_NODE_6046_length_1422_cov_5.589569_1_plen_60_part_10